MKTFYEYLDLPKVPDHLLTDIDSILNQQPINFGTAHLDSPHDPSVRKHWPVKVKQELFEWLTALFDEDILVYYVVSTAPLETHMDTRLYCCNYILANGGEDVTTYAHHDDSSIEYVKFEERRWLKLNNHLPHGTIGKFDNTVRIILQISPKQAYENTKYKEFYNSMKITSNQ